MEFFLQFLAICGFLALLFFSNTFIAHTRKAEKKQRKQAPEPSASWPITGHLHLLRGHEPQARLLGSMADKYGPVFTLRLGMTRAIFISSWELAKECFTTNDKILATRPKQLALDLLGYNYAAIGFAPYGPYWREIRKIITHEILTSRRLELLKSVRKVEIDMSMKELYGQLVNKNGNQFTVEMKKWLGDLILNMITMMVAGKRYFGSSGVNDRRFQHGMDQLFYLSGVFVLSDCLPFLRRLDLGGHERAMKRAMNELDSVMSGLLEEHHRKLQSGMIMESKRDFMDDLLSIAKDAQLPGYDVDTIVKATCMALIVAATDPSTVTLTWALSLMLNNRDVLKKAQDELDIHVGRERHVDESDTKNLVYLQAIIKETLRLYPAVPLLLPHEAIEDCQIGGYHVSAGTRILVNVWKLHRDPRVWTEPNEFRPERFITSLEGVDIRGQHFEFLPFGSGRRMCPGITAAQQVMRLTLARFLQAFDLDTPKGQPVDMTEGLGLSMPKATPLEIILTPRLPSHLYDC